MEWIKLENEKPQEESWVLAYNGCICVKMFERNIFYDGSSSYYCPDGEMSDVTHWMPLPEKPNRFKKL